MNRGCINGAINRRVSCYDAMCDECLDGERRTVRFATLCLGERCAEYCRCWRMSPLVVREVPFDDLYLAVAKACE